MGKLDSKASEMVFWVCKQIEGAVMRSKDVANEQKTETLSHTMHGSVEAEIGKVHPDIDSIKETNLWHTHSVLYSDDMPH